MIWETGNLKREKDQIWNSWKVKKIKSKGEKGMNENEYLESRQYWEFRGLIGNSTSENWEN